MAGLGLAATTLAKSRKHLALATSAALLPAPVAAPPEDELVETLVLLEETIVSGTPS